MVLEQAELVRSDPQQGDRFGRAVALAGDVAVVGAPRDNLAPGVQGGLGGEGAVYVFARSASSWSQAARVISPVPQAEEGFGTSVAIDQGTLVVGAWEILKPLPESGAVYVFTGEGPNWALQAALTPPGTFAPGLFGCSVAIQGDTLLVGDSGDKDFTMPTYAGVVYVYRRDGNRWSLIETLIPSDGQVYDQFGATLSLREDTLVVGAPFHAVNNVRGGAAYVFARSAGGWTEQALLAHPVPADADGFGKAIAISAGRDRIVVGALFDDTAVGEDVGSAHVFVKTGSTWQLEQELDRPDPLPYDNFASAVVFMNRRVFASASFDDHPTLTHPGSVYTFDRSGPAWEPVSKQIPEHVSVIAFGEALSASGASILVGANGVFDAGSAWVLTECADCPEPSAYCTAGTSASGCRAQLQVSGLASASAAAGCRLWGFAAEGDKNGLLYFGTAGRQAIPWGTGTSLQCVVPPVVRTPLIPGGGDPGQCDATFLQDLNAIWFASPKKNPGAGAIVQAQFWYRDPGNTSNRSASLSDAVELAVGP